MSRPTVSYIVAVYNGRRYLAEALGSILGQSRPVDEVVVVDDGSTDDSAYNRRPIRIAGAVYRSAERGDNPPPAIMASAHQGVT